MNSEIIRTLTTISRSLAFVALLVVALICGLVRVEEAWATTL